MYSGTQGILLSKDLMSARHLIPGTDQVVESVCKGKIIGDNIHHGVGDGNVVGDGVGDGDGDDDDIHRPDPLPS